MRCLLNNLDLTVIKDGKVYYPNGRNRPDNLNNNERIIINDVDDGEEFTVVVYAKNLKDKKQTYSLVSTGCYGGVGIGNEMSESQSVASGSSNAASNNGESNYGNVSGVETKSSSSSSKFSSLVELSVVAIAVTL